MKVIKSIMIIACLFTFTVNNAQDLSQKQKEREQVKVKFFTMEEFSDLQIWFENNVKEMYLNEDENNTYRSILNLYVGKMARLDDKDSGLTKDEMILNMNKLIFKLNNGVEPFLSDFQFEKHLHIIDVFEKKVTKKLLKE